MHSNPFLFQSKYYGKFYFTFSIYIWTRNHPTYVSPRGAPHLSQRLLYFSFISESAARATKFIISIWGLFGNSIERTVLFSQIQLNFQRLSSPRISQVIIVRMAQQFRPVEIKILCAMLIRYNGPSNRGFGIVTINFTPAFRARRWTEEHRRG